MKPSFDLSDSNAQQYRTLTLGRAFLAASYFWTVVSCGLAILVIAMLNRPDRFANPSWTSPEYLTTGRWIATAESIFILGIAANGFFATLHFLLPRLTGRTIGRGVSIVSLVVWQGLLVMIFPTIPHGIMGGSPGYAIEWWLSCGFALTWIIGVGYPLLMSMIFRRGGPVYFSLYYLVVGWVTASTVFLLNMMVSLSYENSSFDIAQLLSLQSVQSLSLFAGVADAWIQGWTRWGLLMGLTIAPALAVLLYWMPTVTKKPLQSYRFVVLHLWAMILLLPLSACAMMQFSVMPEWTQSLAFLSNLLFTLQTLQLLALFHRSRMQAIKTVANDRVVKEFATFDEGMPIHDQRSNEHSLHDAANTIAFLKVGLLLNLIASTPFFSRWLGFTMIESVQAFVLVLGVAIPTAWVASRSLPDSDFTDSSSDTSRERAPRALFKVGILIISLVALVIALLQAYQWSATDDNGQPIYADFLQTAILTNKIYYGSTIGYSLLGVGACTLLFNQFRAGTKNVTGGTIRLHQDHLAELMESRKFDRSLLESRATEESSLTGVLELAKKIDRFSQCDWHAWWEERPLVFSLAVLVLMSGAIKLQLIPLAWSQIPSFSSAEDQRIASTESDQLLPLELIGKQIYRSEGCQSCHSQTVRPLIAETARFGNYSTAAEHASQRPVQIGFQRRGPDLARSGGKQSNLWHFQHMIEPASVSRGSLMPSFAHLATQQLDFSSWSERLSNVRSLSGIRPYFIVAANENRALDDSSDKEVTDGKKPSKTIDEKLFEKAARKQSLEVAANLVQQGGPANQQDRKILAVIAYLQRLGLPSVVPGKP